MLMISLFLIHDNQFLNIEFLSFVSNKESGILVNLNLIQMLDVWFIYCFRNFFIMCIWSSLMWVFWFFNCFSIIFNCLSCHLIQCQCLFKQSITAWKTTSEFQSICFLKCYRIKDHHLMLLASETVVNW